jgi:MFS family permease
VHAGWRRNVGAITIASFIGFMGFTLVMPFLPLYFRQLGVADVGEIALWSGLSLGVTPGLTALLAPAWGRLADRVGGKIMIERSLLSFVLVMAAIGFASKPWHVLALRAVQGVFAGYGSLTLAMAAEAAPRERMASAIGVVQMAQRIGPAIGPLVGGSLAALVGLRGAFLISAAAYATALVLVLALYDEPPARDGRRERPEGRVTFRSVLALENFLLLMAVVFGLQFVDRSFGPILPLYVADIGTPIDRVPFVSGLLFSIAAATAALGHHVGGRLLARWPARVLIAGSACGAAAAAAAMPAIAHAAGLAAATAVFGLGIGVAMTASYTAAGGVIPAGAHGAAFGFLTSASLTGLALSPIVSGVLGATSIRAVFLVDALALLVLALLVRRLMVEDGHPKVPPVSEFEL